MSAEQVATMAYVARCNCGGIVYAAVDEPAYRRETGKDIADLLAKGFAIAHEDIEGVRTAVWCSKSKEHMRG